jgi:hypothetical protein
MQLFPVCRSDFGCSFDIQVIFVSFYVKLIDNQYTVFVISIEILIEGYLLSFYLYMINFSKVVISLLGMEQNKKGRNSSSFLFYII